MELLRTLAFDATLELAEGDVEVSPGDLNKLALAMQRLEAAGKWNLQREREMRKVFVEQAAGKVDQLAKGAKKNGLDPETLRRIREEIYGLAPESERA